MNLKEALEVRDKEVVCLVGGGGKTTLMFNLARELSEDHSCVVTTTTTKIMPPSPSQTEELVTEKEEKALLDKVLPAIGRRRHITVALEGGSSEKLAGISTRLASSIANLSGVSHLIIEGDGAARRPLKAPRSHEPVIPPDTTLVVAVVGIDALGGRLEEDNVFRSQIVADLLRIPLGTIVSADMIAELVTRPEGIPKGAPPGAIVVPFINKVDLKDGLVEAGMVARAILARRHPQIPYVLLGRAQCPDPVLMKLRRDGAAAEGRVFRCAPAVRGEHRPAL